MIVDGGVAHNNDSFLNPRPEEMFRVNMDLVNRFINEHQHELHHRIRSQNSSQIFNIEDVSHKFHYISVYLIINFILNLVHILVFQ